MTLTVGNATANLTESAISRTVAATSTIIMGIMDWNATNPPNKLPMTGNSGTATERRDASDGATYAQYLCDWGPGSAGTFDFGPNTADGSTPTTADYTSLKACQAICEVSSSAGTTSVSQFAQVSNWFASAASSITNVSWVTGDAIVVISGDANGQLTAPPTPSNANLSFSPLASSLSDLDTECEIILFSAIAASDQTSQTISLTDPGDLQGGAGLWVVHEISGATAGLTADQSNLIDLFIIEGGQLPVWRGSPAAEVVGGAELDDVRVGDVIAEVLAVGDTAVITGYVGDVQVYP